MSSSEQLSGNFSSMDRTSCLALMIALSIPLSAADWATLPCQKPKAAASAAALFHFAKNISPYLLPRFGGHEHWIFPAALDRQRNEPEHQNQRRGNQRQCGGPVNRNVPASIFL